MKNCEEMTRDVFRRIEEYQIGQKQKRKTIVRMATAACCVCLVALMGFAVWRSGVPTTRPDPFDGDPAVSDDHGGDGHKTPDNHGVLQNDPSADSQGDDPSVPAITEPPAESDPPAENNDEPPAVGGSVCQIHNPAYHFETFEILLDRKGISDEEQSRYFFNRKPDESGCPYPMVNVCNTVKHFNLTREEVEDYLNTTYYDVCFYIDIDALFEEDYEKIRDWAEMSWNESMEKAHWNDKLVIHGVKRYLERRAILNKEYRDLLFHINENFDLDGEYTKEYQNQLKDETLDKDEVERDYLLKKYDVKGKYSQGDSYTLAYLIKTLSVPREDVKRVFEETFKRENSGDEKATWRIDFDKLYGNLDYYADLLGKEGYKYAYQVDEEYIIKDQ